MNVEALNAQLRERARIREGIAYLKITGIDVLDDVKDFAEKLLDVFKQKALHVIDGDPRQI